MHPIERLRYVARAGRGDGGDVARAQEAAWALAALGDDQPGLVTACRRILDRHPGSGALWWLAARVLTSAEPAREAHRVADDLEADPTGGRLAAALPDDATVCLIGWSELVGEAVLRRADLRVLVVDVEDELAGRSSRRDDDGNGPEIVPGPGLGAAAATADLVVLSATALGPGGVVATAGSRAAAAVAHHARVPVWAVAGVGCALAPRLWDALAARVGGRLDPSAPWDGPDETVPLDLIDRVAGPSGLVEPSEAVANADCPVAPELLRATPRLGDAGPDY